MKEIENNRNREKICHAHELEEVTVLKWPYSLRQPTESMYLYQNANDIFSEN